MTEIVKVSSKSSPNAVAGAIAGVLRADGHLEVHVVGAGALNQAVKGIAIARTFLTGGQDVCCRPTFADIEIDGEPRTAMRLLVRCSDHTHEPDAAPGAEPKPEVAEADVDAVPGSDGP